MRAIKVSWIGWSQKARNYKNRHLRFKNWKSPVENWGYLMINKNLFSIVAINFYLLMKNYQLKIFLTIIVNESYEPNKF